MRRSRQWAALGVVLVVVSFLDFSEGGPFSPFGIVFLVLAGVFVWLGWREAVKEGTTGSIRRYRIRSRSDPPPGGS